MSERQASLGTHLEELRKRLLWSVLIILAATIVTFAFYKQIIDFLLLPADSLTDVRGRLVFIDVTEMFGVIMKVSFISGFVLAFPLILHQIVMFVSPGLTRQERVYLYALLPGVLLAFIGGAAFSFFLVAPRAVDFLVNFGGEIAEPNIRISNYVNLITMLMFWMGVVFETPVVMFLLSKLRIVSPGTYGKYRRHWVVVAFVLAALITPTFDPVNQALVAAPLIVLYEAGIWLSRLAVRGQALASQPSHT